MGEDPAQPQKAQGPERGGPALMVSPGGARPGSCGRTAPLSGRPRARSVPGSPDIVSGYSQAEPFSSPACWVPNSPHFIPGPSYPHSRLRACVPIQFSDSFPSFPGLGESTGTPAVAQPLPQPSHTGQTTGSSGLDI